MNRGIKYQYPRLKPKLGDKLTGFIMLGRPFTLLIVAICAFAMSVASLHHAGLSLNNNILVVFYITGAWVICNYASNAYNQVTDFLEDSLSKEKQHRPLASGLVTREEATTLAVMGFFIAIMRGFITSVELGVGVVVVSAITFLYSEEPIRLKKRFLLNNFTLALARGFVPPLSIWAIWNPLSTPIMWFAIALTIFLFFNTTTKDFGDIAGDMEVGNRTIPVVLGTAWAKRLLAVGMFVPFVLFYFINPYFLVLLPVVAVMIGMLFWFDTKPMESMEYNRIYLLGYVLFTALYVVFAGIS